MTRAMEVTSDLLNELSLNRMAIIGNFYNIDVAIRVRETHVRGGTTPLSHQPIEGASPS